jgi:hypothetical protein
MPHEGLELLGLAVRWRDVSLGSVEDVILEPETKLPLGLVVRCLTGERRFLATAASQVRAGQVFVHSPLTLLEPQTLRFYQKQGLSLLGELGDPRGFDARATG